MVHCIGLMVDPCSSILTDACDPFVTLQWSIFGSMMHYCSIETVEKCDIVIL